MGAFRRVAVAGERESTSGARTRELDDCVLHHFKRERVSIIDVGKKLFGGLLVAGRVREVDAHESDECVNVGTVTGFMWHSCDTEALMTAM